MTPVALQPGPQAVGFFTYGHASFDVAGAAGGSRNVLGKDAASFIAGAEYPITEHLAFTGEWFSGNHNFSALIPGFAYYHRGDLIVVAGYKITNDFDPRGYGPVIEVGYSFGGPRKSEPEQERHHGDRPPRRRTGFRSLLGGAG
jgi:hypothetical protein